MIVAGFDWDGGNRRKCVKHGVSIRAIEEIFAGEMAVFPDPGHSRDEERLKAIGKTRAGRHVFGGLARAERTTACSPCEGAASSC